MNGVLAACVAKKSDSFPFWPPQPTPYSLLQVITWLDLLLHFQRHHFSPSIVLRPTTPAFRKHRNLSPTNVVKERATRDNTVFFASERVGFSCLDLISTPSSFPFFGIPYYAPPLLRPLFKDGYCANRIQSLSPTSLATSKQLLNLRTPL